MDVVDLLNVLRAGNIAKSREKAVRGMNQRQEKVWRN
jgi:hypothetical protein